MASADVSSASPGLEEAGGGLSPGEFVLKKLFAEFVAISDKKLEHVAKQPLVSATRGYCLASVTHAGSPSTPYPVDIHSVASSRLDCST